MLCALVLMGPTYIATDTFGFNRCQRYVLLANPTSIVVTVRQTAPLVACPRALSEGSRQQSPEIGGIDLHEPIWIRKISFNNLLWINEEVLR
jgi:hypothetical protein